MLANQFKSKVLDLETCVVIGNYIKVYNQELGRYVIYEAPVDTKFSSGDTVKASISPPSFKMNGRMVALVGSGNFRREERWLEKKNT